MDDSNNRRRHWLIAASHALTKHDFDSELCVKECTPIMEDGEKVVMRLHVEKKVRPKTITDELRRLLFTKENAISAAWIGRPSPAAKTTGKMKKDETAADPVVTKAVFSPDGLLITPLSDGTVFERIPGPSQARDDDAVRHPIQSDDEEPADDCELMIIDGMIGHLDAIRKQMLALKKRLRQEKQRGSHRPATTEVSSASEKEDDPPRHSSKKTRKATPQPPLRTLWVLLADKPPRPPIRLSFLRTASVSELFFQGVWIPDYDLDDIRFRLPEDTWNNVHPRRWRRYKSECLMLPPVEEEESTQKGEDEFVIDDSYIADYDIDDVDLYNGCYSACPVQKRLIDVAHKAIYTNRANWLRFVPRLPQRDPITLTALRAEPISVLYELAAFAPGYDILDEGEETVPDPARADRFLASEFQRRDLARWAGGQRFIIFQHH